MLITADYSNLEVICSQKSSVIFFWEFKISIALHLKRKVKRLFKPKFYLSKNQRLFNLFSNSKCDSFSCVYTKRKEKDAVLLVHKSEAI